MSASPADRPDVPGNFICFPGRPDRSLGLLLREEFKAPHCAAEPSFRNCYAPVFRSAEFRNVRSIRAGRRYSLVGRVHHAAEYTAFPLRRNDGAGDRDTSAFCGFLRCVPALLWEQLFRAADLPVLPHRAQHAVCHGRGEKELRIRGRRGFLHDHVLLYPAASRDLYDGAFRLYLRAA